MVQFKAVWEPGYERFFKNKDPQAIAEEIYSISDSPTKEQIVDKARDENSELHDLFEWDDAVAAEEWRQEQAKNILRKLKVEFIQGDGEKEPATKEFRPVRLFFGNPNDRKGFVSIFKIMEDKETYQNLLNKAKAELVAFENKYKMLEELNPIFEIIHKL